VQKKATPPTFGKEGSIVGNPRSFQMALRYDFGSARGNVLTTGGLLLE
jgi:hypothetical protein